MIFSFEHRDHIVFWPKSSTFSAYQIIFENNFVVLQANWSILQIALFQAHRKSSKLNCWKSKVIVLGEKKQQNQERIYLY